MRETILPAVAALGFALLPVAACAEGVSFTVPDHYFVAKSATVSSASTTYRVWAGTIKLGHSLVVSASAADGSPLAAVVDRDVAGVRGRGAVDVVRDDAEPLCGVPSIRLSYAYPRQLRYAYRYVVVDGRLLIASYARPIADADDPTALAALSSLCSGIYQSAGPIGWAITAPYPPNNGAWSSPDGKESFVQFPARSAESRGDIALEPYKGTNPTLSDGHETCGSITIHRYATTYKDTIIENADGTVRGYRYSFSYQRPADRPPIAEAIAALTGFCSGK